MIRPDNTDRLLLELLYRIAPVYVSLVGTDSEEDLDARLLRFRDRRPPLVNCQSSWEFVVVDRLTGAGLQQIGRK